MRSIKYIVIWTILIATMGLALNFIWPNTITYISQIKTHPTADMTITIYKYNFGDWLKNLSYASANLPNLKIENIEFTADNTVLLILETIANLIIFAINIAIFPVRIIAYITQLLMAFTGLNIDPDAENNAFTWLVKLTDFLINRFAIDYI